MTKARITVTLKNGVLDPQGKAIEGSLAALGFDGVGDRLTLPSTPHTGTGDFSIFAWVKTADGMAGGSTHTIVNYGTTLGYGAAANLKKNSIC